MGSGAEGWTIWVCSECGGIHPRPIGHFAPAIDDPSVHCPGDMEAVEVLPRSEVTPLLEALKRISVMPEGASTDGGLRPTFEARIASDALKAFNSSSESEGERG